MNDLVDGRSNLIDIHLIQSLKNEFCFDLPLFSKYPATFINSYFYKMTLIQKKGSISGCNFKSPVPVSVSRPDGASVTTGSADS